MLAIGLSIAMLFLNAYVIPGRGQMLNWSVEFKGGSEIVARFAKPVEAGQVREALESAGYHGVEAIEYITGKQEERKTHYLIRMGAVTAVSRDQARQAEAKLQGADDRRRQGAELRVVRGRRQGLPALRQGGRSLAVLEPRR